MTVVLAAAGSVMVDARGAGLLADLPAAGWFALGVSYSASITPGGRLLRRSSDADGRPALFAAQFALSHVCWLVAYPLAGQVGARAGMGTALAASAVLALMGTLIALRIWPRAGPGYRRRIVMTICRPIIRIFARAMPKAKLSHAFVIDELHSHWPDR